MTRALTLATSVALFALAAPATAQGQAAPAPVANAAAQSFCPLDVSNGARGKLVAYQNAVVGKAADAAAKGLEAKAVAKKPADKCMVAQFDYFAAANAASLAGQQAALDAMLASGVGDKTKIFAELMNLGKLRYNAKDFVGAAQAFAAAKPLNPTSAEPLMLLAEAQLSGNQVAQAMATYKAALALGGAKADEQFMKRAIGVAMKSSPADVVPLARDWAGAYPSPVSWREAINLYVKNSGKGEPDLVDIRRLQFAANALAGESEYGVLALTLNGKGLSTEAARVLDAGINGVKISKTSPSIATVYGKAAARLAAEKAGLAGKTSAGLAAGASFDTAMNAGDLNYGAGNFAKAAELYRAALAKGGNTDLANLRLGMALAQAGDKAGAKAALAAAGGEQAMVASFWQAWLATRA